jgi:GDP/UDP-N,N'-diacetylbacillosamine 2-epimerase (hydrolysing)
MKKKVCVITTTRAEYGLLKLVMEHFKKSAKLELQIIATGTHLEKKYGYTLDEIINDGFLPNDCISIIKNDSKTGILKTAANAIQKVGDSIAKLDPDMVILLGDRYETLAIATACVILNIPIAHISGGDVTYGAYDDIFRHSITKMSYLHFTSSESSRNRIIQMGESPERVFNVGELGVENILKLSFLPKEKLEEQLELNLENTLLATFHPVTMESSTQKEQFEQLLLAIKEQNQYNVLFTRANADTNRDELDKLLNEYAKKYPQKIKIVDSLGTLKYLSAMKYCAGVIGNSSSGIVEAPSLKKGTINIGNRQKGRICGQSIINCNANKKEIAKAFETLSSKEFKENLKTVQNPYEGKNPSKIIASTIEETVYKKLSPKIFHDLH